MNKVLVLKLRALSTPKPHPNYAYDYILYGYYSFVHYNK